MGNSTVRIGIWGRHVSIAVATLLLQSAAAQPSVMSSASASIGGLDAQYFDPAVRPQDDLYRYVNGKWLDTVAIPADKSRYGTFYELSDKTEAQLLTIITALAADTATKDNTEAQKIRDLYASFMNEAQLEVLGLKPLQTQLATIDGINTAGQLPAAFARLLRNGVNVPIVAYVHQDNRNSTHYAFDLYQAGLGLPDRDYYLKDGDDGAYKKAREAYQRHIATMFTLAAQSQPEQSAAQILQLETALATAQWDKVTNRNPIKTYNKYPLRKLTAVAHDFNWRNYLRVAGVQDKIDYVLISQPSYITTVAKLTETVSLQTWQRYLKWKVIESAAPYLSKSIVDENFAFNGKILRGIPDNRARWKRGLSVTESAIGEGFGKLYVDKYFPPENMRRMQALVANLLTAYRQSIDTLDWMSPATKQQAQAKLAKITIKIGYPNQWRDYSILHISADDLLGNIIRADQFEYQREINKLGQPIDRSEWQMTPQTINAYYNPEMNEIVFPAAILQPPFFNMQADDAVNYGAIGAVIGHEISHGFDDQGSQYDGDGNLRDWWTPADHAQFAAKTKALVAQYAAYESVPGYHLNGELTLGENIADLSGLAIAYKAYELSMQTTGARQSVPNTDGLTGEQRFFFGWAQAWREKAREPEAIRLVTIDAHSPPRFRAMGVVVNLNAFYSAFDIKPADKMYVSPEQRVSIW